MKECCPSLPRSLSRPHRTLFVEASTSVINRFVGEEGGRREEGGGDLFVTGCEYPVVHSLKVGPEEMSPDCVHEVLKTYPEFQQSLAG